MKSGLDLEVVRELAFDADRPQPEVREHARAAFLAAANPSTPAGRRSRLYNQVLIRSNGLVGADRAQALAATRGDPESTSKHNSTLSRRRWWLRFGTRPPAVLAVVAVIGACGATIGSIKFGVGANPKSYSHDSPQELFRANPQGAGIPPGVRSHQDLVAGSVRLASTLRVPSIGRLQYWIAQSAQHGLCEAIRLPDGTWIGGANKFNIGGEVPGCMPAPSDKVSFPRLIDGYYYDDATIEAPHGRWWRIEYGVAPTRGHPVKVRDTVSGASAPIVDGRYFAILLSGNITPLPNKSCSLIYVACWPFVRLQTLNAAGQVLSQHIPSRL